MQESVIVSNEPDNRKGDVDDIALTKFTWGVRMEMLLEWNTMVQNKDVLVK